MWSSPDDYYAWQTLIYLGLFSFTMSWVAQLAVGEGLTVDIIATCGWIFFCPGHWVAAGRSQDPLFLVFPSLPGSSGRSSVCISLIWCPGGTGPWA